MSGRGVGDDGALDDVDRLFARLAPLPPPRGLAASVLLAARSRRAGPRTLVWAVAELAAIAGLALIAFTAGQALVGGGALALLAAVFANAEVVALAPGEVMLAVAEAIPWIELLALAVGTLVVVLVTRALTRSLVEPPTRAAGTVP